MSFQDYPTALRKESILHGRYIIEDVIGQGNFGITYKALDFQTQAIIAIKEYFPAAMSIRRDNRWVVPGRASQSTDFAEGKQWFLQEVKTLAAFIGSPNMLKIYSYFEENGTAYFVMEYVSGISLTEYIQKAGGRISWARTWELLIPVMDALTAIHSRNIIHRDIKPDNIIIMKDGNAKVLDFGAARYSYGQQSRSLDVILTRGYAPLEQYYRRGKQGPWTDVYALAATMYSAIMGEIPPDAVKRQPADELKMPVSIGSPIPPYARDALLKALSIQPVERFGSVGEFRKAILRESARVQGPEIEAQRKWLQRCQILAREHELALRKAGEERRLEQERREQERREQERLEKERIERERIERERLERERKERERRERERLELERQKKLREQQLEREREEQKRIEEEKKKAFRKKVLIGVVAVVLAIILFSAIK